MKKRVVVLFLVAFALIQLKRPIRNEEPGRNRNDITYLYAVPEEVQLILKTGCYDCHSNHSTYPWYSNIQPVGWWLQIHIDEGKNALNFSEFGTYYKEDHSIIFREMHEVVTERTMPLNSYVLMHEEANFTDEQIAVLDRWIQGLRTSIAKDR